MACRLSGVFLDFAIVIDLGGVAGGVENANRLTSPSSSKSVTVQYVVAPRNPGVRSGCVSTPALLLESSTAIGAADTAEDLPRETRNTSAPFPERRTLKRLTSARRPGTARAVIGVALVRREARLGPGAPPRCVGWSETSADRVHQGSLGVLLELRSGEHVPAPLFPPCRWRAVRRWHAPGSKLALMRAHAGLKPPRPTVPVSGSD